MPNTNIKNTKNNDEEKEELDELFPENNKDQFNLKDEEKLLTEQELAVMQTNGPENVYNENTAEQEVISLATEAEGDLKKTEKQESAPKEADEEVLSISKTKIFLVKRLLENIKENNEQLIRIFNDLAAENNELRIKIAQKADSEFFVQRSEKDEENESKIIEGVFNGEFMIGPDGKQYNVPSNYASKSKLVEGDIMKLTITPNGTFLYKQIGPIERERIVGELLQEEDGNFYVTYQGNKWRVLTASATYYKGSTGDEAVILIPKHGISRWGAVDNIIKKRI